MHHSKLFEGFSMDHSVRATAQLGCNVGDGVVDGVGGKDPRVVARLRQRQVGEPKGVLLGAQGPRSASRDATEPDLSCTRARAARRGEMHVGEQRVLQEGAEGAPVGGDGDVEHEDGGRLGLEATTLVVDRPGVEASFPQRPRESAAACADFEAEWPRGHENVAVTAEAPAAVGGCRGWRRGRAGGTTGSGSMPLFARRAAGSARGGTGRRRWGRALRGGVGRRRSRAAGRPATAS